MSIGPEYVRERTIVEDDGVVRTDVPLLWDSPPAGGIVIPANQAVHQVVATAPAMGVRISYSRGSAIDAVVTAAVGLFVTIVGLLAVTRAGFDGPMDTPVVKVLGATHTVTLGLIESAIGLCLLISGASRWRSGALFFGTVLGIGAFVGAVQTDTFAHRLALTSGWAWLMVVLAIVVVAAALLIPRSWTRTTTVR